MLEDAGFEVHWEGWKAVLEIRSLGKRIEIIQGQEDINYVDLAVYRQEVFQFPMSRLNVLLPKALVHAGQALC